MSLTELFTDIADAIRTKKGTTDEIVASNFPSEIKSIKSAEDVTLFASVEEMNNSTGHKTNDLTVIYTDTQYLSETATSGTIYWPATVVLDEQLTGDNIKKAISSSYKMTVTPTSMMLYKGPFYSGTTVEYTSADGITYTITKNPGTTSLGTISATHQANIVDYMRKFLVTAPSNFGGIYSYGSDKFNLANTQLDATSKYVCNGKIFYGKNGLETGAMEAAISDDTDMLRAYVNVWVALSNITVNFTDMVGAFDGKTNLTEIPMLDTSNVTGMASTFYNCTNLVTIPLLNTSKVTNMNSTFSGCTNLSNASLNNILAMCKNAPLNLNAGQEKTLFFVGLTEAQANICKTLSNYQAFLNAGWTTGY